MFTQLFGNFLLQKGIVTTEQLIEAIKHSSESHIKVGSLAIHSGYMTPEQVERVYIFQTHEDALFGQIAIRENFINEEQLDEILRQQTPSYLKVGQYFVDHNIFSNTELDSLIHEYQTEYKIPTLENQLPTLDDVHHLVRSFCNFADITKNEHLVSYLHLLFNNLIRFIGSDFTTLNVTRVAHYDTTYASTQTVDGIFHLQSGIDVNAQTGTIFASRYAGEDFSSFDEYCHASLDDFLNLHNGLFLVNMSNMWDIELTLTPTEELTDVPYISSGETYVLPVIFTFGTVNFLFTI